MSVVAVPFALLKKSGIPLYGAALREDTLDARTVDYSRCAIAIGSEGRGLTDGVLALCAHPFLHLGIQYLLYKLTAFLASVIGDTELCGLIGGLGGAFGLILGMVGSCALVLLVSILASAAVVTS